MADGVGAEGKIGSELAGSEVCVGNCVGSEEGDDDGRDEDWEDGFFWWAG